MSSSSGISSLARIIGDTGFFRGNALAVLLFEAIFKLNKASPTPEMQIAQWLSSNRNSQASPSMSALQERETLAL